MANTIILPYTIITNPHTPKRRQWRRYTTTMTINTKPRLPSPSSSHFVHNSTSNLPDIVNDCHHRQEDIVNANEEIKLTCKEIAQSLRLVADQMDKKYCQDADFHRDLHCLSIRLVFHTTHIRTILYTFTIELILCKVQKRQWLVDEKKDDGFTALHLAALNGHYLIVELLLTKGNASINLQNISLQTALHLAVSRQHLQIVTLLSSQNADVNLTDKDGDTCLHEALRHHTLSQLKQLQDIGDNGKIMNIFTNSNGYDKRASVAIACTLVMYGADLTARNKKNQTPFDLCSDPHLCRILTQKNIEYKREQKKNQKLLENSNSIECLVCSDNKRDIIFQPCSHIVTCHSCAGRVKKCLLCKEKVQTRIKIEKCQICSKRKASVAFRPCGHLIVCEECVHLKKICFLCRLPIDSTVSFNQLCLGINNTISLNPQTTATISSNNNISDAVSLARLQQELKEIRDQVHCPICMDRLKNMVFLCGHGVCQNCGDRIQECPICRKQIEKSIILYT